MAVRTGQEYIDGLNDDREVWYGGQRVEKITEFEEFRTSSLSHLDETMWHLAQSEELDQILVRTVQTMFPSYEHDQFIAHFRGLIRHWVESQAG